MFTFGAGNHGQLGHDISNDELLPKKVMELMGSTVTQVCCGRYVPVGRVGLLVFLNYTVVGTLVLFVVLGKKSVS